MRERAECQVPGCDERVRCKGLCARHYQQTRHGGELTLGRRRTGPPKRPKQAPPGTVLRRCLGYCGQMFWSEWPGNRVCEKCGRVQGTVRDRRCRSAARGTIIERVFDTSFE